MQNTQSAIDSFIQLLHLDTALDHYCHLRGDFSLDHEPLAEGQAYFHLIIAGNCQLHIKDQHYTLKSGDFLLLPKGQAHQLKRGETNSSTIHIQKQPLASKTNHRSSLNSSADLEMMCGYFHSPQRAAAQLMQQLSQPLHISLEQQPALINLYRLIQHEAQHAAAGSASIIRNLCETLLIYALRHAEQEKLPHIGLFSDPLIAQILPLISADFSQQYPIETLAAHLHLSPSNLARRFKKAANISVQQFIRLLRMNHAAQLLRHSQSPINHIIQACGYQSEAAFHDNFRKQFNCTPQQFRRQNKTIAPNPPNL